MKITRKEVFWWLAFSVGLFVLGIHGIHSAWTHTGPGYITYEEPDRTERVSDAHYKRHHYSLGGCFIVVGSVVAVAVIRSAAQNKSAGRRD